ncbi:hypothetical protein T492DRAFT_1011905, partial [Pavlovales sp. CCMP2436]
FFGGGFPGFDQEEMMGRRPRGDVDTTGFYTSLELEKNCSAEQIKKQYRKMAAKHHPDKGGDIEKFKECQKAYEVLSDPEKRQLYDRYGEEGVESGGGGGGGGGSSDLFDMLSGRGRQQRQPQGMRKGQNVVHQLTVSLEEIYMGKTRKLRMRREVIESGSMSTCTECGGKGVNIRVVRMGPMIQQVQEGCRACDGQGSQYQSKQVQEVMEVVVPKGAPDGYKLTFHEKADEIAAGIPGDVIFVLQESAHPEFKRKGADLYVKRSISLVEALCGFRMELTHLDGRKLLIKTGPGQGINLEGGGVASAPMPVALTNGRAVKSEDFFFFFFCPNLDALSRSAPSLRQVSCNSIFYILEKLIPETQFSPDFQAQRMMFAVKDEGMPVFKSPMEQGNLFLILDIVFPDHLDAAAMASLKAALPPALHASSVGDDDENYDVVELVKLDPVHSFKATAVDSSNDATQEDEREAAGGGVQCAQQ